MKVFNFFPTNVWVGNLDIDNKKLLSKIYKFSKRKKSETVSNEGGYQGHLLGDEEFYDKVIKCMPRQKDLYSYTIYDWVNINKKGSKNNRHYHYNSDLFLSGVYYVKVPESSGRIRFYDPRGPFVRGAADTVHFYGDNAYQYIVPQEGMILFFPTWLEHDVEENQSDEDRVSIAFNIKVE
tara:strand:+ start:52 stop:591 length:540 start_codon:yes stop_codon:yes gene_type:complete